MPLITTETIVASLYSYFHNRAWDTCFASIDHLKRLLKQTVDKSLDRYKVARPYTGTDGRVPFYDSQVIVEELLKYRVMHAEDYDVAQLLSALASDPRLVPPEKADIDEFYRIFMEEVHSNEQLRVLEIKATFTTEIFLISAKIDQLQRSLDQLSRVFNADLAMQWKSRADAYFELIRQFKFASALMLLDAFEQSFTDSEQSPPPRILASIAYQKAICYQYLGRLDELRKSYVRAYQLYPENKLFKQRAALAYMKLGQKEKALALAGELVDADEYDYMGWAVRALCAEIADLPALLAEVPPAVKSDLAFLAATLNSADAGKKHPALELFFEQGLIPPIKDFTDKPVSVDSYAEYIFWIDTTINRLFRNFYCNFRAVDCGDCELVTFLNRILGKFLDAVNGTEITNVTTLLPFLRAYTSFCLTSEAKFALEMAECYDAITVKDDLFVLIAANALQLSGQPEKALAMLAKTSEESDGTRLLKGVCAMAMHDENAFADYTRAWIASLDTVESYLVPNFIESMLQLKFFNKLKDFRLEDYLEGKVFETNDDELLVTTLAKALFEGSSPERNETIRRFADTLSSKELLSMIGMICYLIGEFELAITVFRKYIDTTVESRGLLFYIYSLYNTRKDNKELLDLVAYWRLNFSLHGDFLRLEMQLRRDRLEWPECIAIGSYFLKQYPNDEFMLALYVYALQEEGSTESRQKLKELAPELAAFDFKVPTYAGQIADILIRQKHFREGLELLYRYAVQPGNTELKMPYFMAVVACGNYAGDEGLIAEFETVTEGTFVKYKLNDKVHIVELNEANLRNPFYREFIGCNKGGAFTYPRAISGEEDFITIERVMNKYLALHDEILEQVRNNPHSGIPMESFDFDGPEGMLEKFQKYFGRQGTEAHDSFQEDLRKYHSFELSLTELVFRHGHGHYLATYYQVVTEHGGIRTLPLTTFAPPEGETTEYVLDYTSLAMLYQICKAHQVTFPDKFLLSAFILDQLRKELARQEGAGPELSLSVRADMVIPHWDEQASRQNNVIYLQGLIAWIGENCTIMVSDRLHDFLRQFEQRAKERPFTEYSLNTALLVDDVKERKLITDDFIYSRFGFLNISNLASAEYYVRKVLGSDHPALFEFIRNRYHSFAVSDLQLNEEYHKKQAGQHNYYDSCLENLSLMINPQAVMPAIRHIKHLALYDLGGTEQTGLAITQIFVRLIGRDASPLVKTGILLLIRQECYLLGTRLDAIIAAFYKALAIIDNS